MSRLKALFTPRKSAFGPDEELSEYFHNKFKVKVKNEELYKQALTHKSISSDCNNERLEYLGDTILSSIVVSYLFKKFPKKTEGELTVLTSKIVNRKKLNEIGEILELSDQIIAVEYEEGYKNIVGNTFEAVVGAIYLDLGFNEAQQAIKKTVFELIDLNKIDEEEVNFKSVLIVWGQKTGNKVVFKGKKLPESSKYKSILYINGKKINTIAKDSKKEAEQKIAEVALSRILLKD